METEQSSQQVQPAEVKPQIEGEGKKRVSLWRVILLVMLGVAFLLIGGVGGYWVGLKQEETNSENEVSLSLDNEINHSSETAVTSLSPSVNSEDKYQIINGSLYNDNQIVVDVRSIIHESLAISEIRSFHPSPDQSKILLRTEGEVSTDLLFIYDNANNKNIFIDTGEDAEWSPDSRYIAYTRRPADVGPLTLYVFDTVNMDKVSSVTSQTDIHTTYDNLRWSDDSTHITAHYTTYDEVPYGNIVNEGETVIEVTP